MNENKITVGISDARLSKNAGDVLVTYSLGSCIGVTLYDPVARIGGMLHCMQPCSEDCRQSEEYSPFKFADTGLASLYEKVLSTGAVARRLQVKIAGGAKRLSTINETFNIGKRNYVAVRKALWKCALRVTAEEVGGTIPRTMYLNMENGAVMIGSQGTKRLL
jgi:chemotaxis protein CheD